MIPASAAISLESQTVHRDAAAGPDVSQGGNGRRWQAARGEQARGGLSSAAAELRPGREGAGALERVLRAARARGTGRQRGPRVTGRGASSAGPRDCGCPRSWGVARVCDNGL